MYEIYAVIGVVLITVGVTSSIYFSLRMKRSKYEKCFIESLSDGLGTLFLGIFYIYCYLVLSENMENISTTLHFPEIEETYLNVSTEESMNPDIFTTIANIHIKPVTFITSSTNDMFKESDTSQTEVDNESSTTQIITSEVIFSTSLDNNETETNTIAEEVTQSPFVDVSNDTFTFYQNYFKDILRLKTANNSDFENRTIFVNNTEYLGLKTKTKSRTRRETTRIINKIFKNTNKQCLKVLFLKHALLISSFLYSIICLIKNTKLYHTYKNESKGKAEMENENSKPKDESEISSENLSGSSGELFFVNCNADNEENKRTAEVKNEKEPNLDIFLAKSSNSPDSTEKIEAQSCEKLISTRSRSILPQVIKLLVIWFMPGLCIYSLHMMMDSTNQLSSSSSITDAQYNFSTTRANSEMLKLLHSPLNVTTHGKSKEINDVVKNVYDIVGRANELSKTKNSSMTNVIYEIVYFLNDKFHKRNESMKEDCFFYTISLKLHSFILFCLIYFASILYAKILQLKMNQDQSEYTNLIRLFIFIFSIIWLPSILELFSRIYVFNEKPSTAAGSTLALGNLFVLFNNLNNYLLNRHVTKIRVNAKI